MKKIRLSIILVALFLTAGVLLSQSATAFKVVEMESMQNPGDIKVHEFLSKDELVKKMGLDPAIVIGEEPLKVEQEGRLLLIRRSVPGEEGKVMMMVNEDGVHNVGSPNGEKKVMMMKMGGDGDQKIVHKSGVDDNVKIVVKTMDGGDGSMAHKMMHSGGDDDMKVIVKKTGAGDGNCSTKGPECCSGKMDKKTRKKLKKMGINMKKLEKNHGSEVICIQEEDMAEKSLWIDAEGNPNDLDKLGGKRVIFIEEDIENEGNHSKEIKVMKFGDEGEDVDVKVEDGKVIIIKDGERQVIDLEMEIEEMMSSKKEDAKGPMKIKLKKVVDGKELLFEKEYDSKEEMENDPELMKFKEGLGGEHGKKVIHKKIIVD